MIHLLALLHSASTTSTTVSHTSGGSGIYSILNPIAKPIAGLLAAIYSVIPNYGVAILLLSLMWMIIISPLTLKSTRSMLAMQKLQPQLKRLQEQHKGDRQAFAQAQMELFREHNVSPFGSCLPMLLPLPVFFALFEVIEGLSHKTNGVPTPKYLSSGTEMYKHIVAAHGQLNAFGMDLAKNAFSPHAGILAALPFWIVLLVMAATSYTQSAMMLRRNSTSQRSNPQMRMMKYLPLVFVVFCIRFPAGVCVYYVMSNISRIVQQDFMYRFDPKVKTLVAKEVVEVEALTHEIDERQQNKPGYTPPRSARSAPAAPSSGSSGRSRFRDLLSAAAEQQKAQQQKTQQAKPQQAKPQPRTPAKAAPNGNGSARGAGSGTKAKPGANGTSKGTGAAAAAGAARSGRSGQGKSRSGSGSRTNRKRRGR